MEPAVEPLSIGRDPRAKIFVLLVFLVARRHRPIGPCRDCRRLLLVSASPRHRLAARIPRWPALPRRAALVLPFTAVFVVVCWLAGDRARGLALALKSYLSALAVLAGDGHHSSSPALLARFGDMARPAVSC